MQPVEKALSGQAWRDPWQLLALDHQHGHLEVVEGLLAEGCKADTKDKMGMTPMHAAADVDDSSVMAKLVETAEGKAAINAVDEVRGHICVIN